MTDFKSVLIKLNSNLNLLREREAKYAGSAPLDLLNQIADHQKAIELTRQVINDDLSEAEWREATHPLLLALHDGQVVNIDTGGGAYIEGTVTVSGGDFVGRDQIKQTASGSYIAQATHSGTATVNVENIGQKIVNFFTGGSDQQRELRNRQITLQRVRDFWVKGVLENSLHNEILIELGIEERKEAVEYPWDMIIQRPNQPNRQLPPGTKIIDVFDQAGQSLLILGEPGSGKTTMLLDLARQTIARAQADPLQPLPVVFNLSAWEPWASLATKRDKQQLSFGEWVMTELKGKYSIPQKLAQYWLDNDILMLLLDGLDEVGKTYRDECVQAINRFCHEHMMALVICSRTADYKDLSAKLSLQQAIVLKPLTEEQVDNYLTKLGSRLVALQTALKNDSNLRDMSQSPLMLSIMTLVYKSLSFNDISQLSGSETSRQSLFKFYVQQMFRRRGVSSTFPPNRTCYWLAWLAQRNQQTLLLIDEMEPSKSPSITHFIITVLIFGLLFGLAFLIIGSQLNTALCAGPFIGLFYILVFGLLPANLKGDITQKSNYGIWSKLIKALKIGLSIGFTIGSIAGLITGMTSGWGAALTVGLRSILVCVLIVGLGSGGDIFIQHFVLRFVLYTRGSLPWNLTDFLDYCVDRIFLRKVGGGYIFIHRYLMEYFASLTPEDIERLSREVKRV